MRARLLAAALAVTFAAGCGKPPEGPGPTLNVPTAPTAGKGAEAERKRAVAGKEPFAVGPITAEVIGVKYAKPEAEDGSLIEDTEFLNLFVRLTTSDQTVSRRIESDIVRAKDEFGNSYQRRKFIGATLAGDEEGRPVRAGQSVVMRLLIEKPIPKATRLDVDIEHLGDTPALFLFTVTLPEAGR